MSDIVSFVLQLKDMMSGGIQKVGVTARSVFGGIDGVVNKTQAGLNGLGKEVHLKVNTSGLQDANREVERLHSRMNNMAEGGGLGFGGTAGAMFLGGLGMQAAMMAGQKVIEAGKSMLESGMAVQNMKVGLSTFVGDKKADFIVEDVMKSSARTPYTTQALLPGIRGLIGYGIGL